MAGFSVKRSYKCLTSSWSLSRLENGFASLSQFKLCDTVAAGDGIVFRMLMPTNEQVYDDVTAH